MYHLNMLTTIKPTCSMITTYICTSGGRHDAPKVQKIFWATMEGATASVLLLYGGLTALQSATTITGLAFAVILVVMVFSFYLSLKKYYKSYAKKE